MDVIIILCATLSHLSTRGIISLATTVRCHHGRRLLQGTLELLVSIFLDGLRVLQFLYQFHLQLLHLHDFFFLLRSHVIFIVHAIIMLSLDIMESTLTVFFNFHGGQAFLLIYNLILHAIFLFNFKVIKLLLLLVLLLDNL